MAYEEYGSPGEPMACTVEMVKEKFELQRNLPSEIDTDRVKVAIRGARGIIESIVGFGLKKPYVLSSELKSQPDAASTYLTFVSSAATDTCKVEITGTVGGSETTEEITLLGTTSVNTTKDFSAITKVRAERALNGTVTITDSTSKVLGYLINRNPYTVTESARFIAAGTLARDILFELGLEDTSLADEWIKTGKDMLRKSVNLTDPLTGDSILNPLPEKVTLSGKSDNDKRVTGMTFTNRLTISQNETWEDDKDDA